MPESSSSTSSGTSFTGLLQLLFIALKLTGYITWSWFWVLAPLWIAYTIFGICCIIIWIDSGKAKSF